MALLTQGCSFFQSNFTLVGFFFIAFRGNSFWVIRNSEIKIRSKMTWMPENYFKTFQFSRITLLQ